MIGLRREPLGLGASIFIGEGNWGGKCRSKLKYLSIICKLGAFDTVFDHSESQFHQMARKDKGYSSEHWA